jgi:hypothetical protein
MLRARSILLPLRFRTLPLKNIRRPTEILLGTYLYFRNSAISLNTQEGSQHIPKPLIPALEAATHTQSFLKGLYERLRTFLRFLHLAIIFTPVALLFPLRLFKATDDIWCWVFVNAIERAGVVWIKAFQYLSHRRDIIGDRLAAHLVHLREHAPAHTF